MQSALSIVVVKLYTEGFEKYYMYTSSAKTSRSARPTYLFVTEYTRYSNDTEARAVS
jgi:hypothetical protein